MRRIVMTAAASAMLGSGAASAGDFYTGEPGSGFKDGPVYAVNSWSGFYFGTNGGGAWSSQAGNLNVRAIESPAFTSANAKVSPSGVFGGAQAGYNWQTGGLVLGVEADVDVSHVYDKPSQGTSVYEPSIPSTGAASAAAKSVLDDFGTVRARAGYSFGSLLVYGSGGFAFGSVQDRLTTNVFDAATSSVTSGSVSSDRTAAGWAAGGGFQYAFTPALSWKAEYLHLDLGSTSLSQPPLSAGSASASAGLTVHHGYDIFRTGLNYRFGTGQEPAILDVYTGLFGGGGGLKDAPVNQVPWAGFYGGLNTASAYSEHEGTLTATASGSGTTAAGRAKESPSGWSAGGQIGYNWQFGAYVLGVEADANAAAGVEDKASVSAAGIHTVSQAAAKSDLDDFGTLRMRAGYSFGRVLVYGTGGFAFGGVRDRVSLTNIETGTSASSSGSTSETATGWAAGGGVEIAMTPQWSLKTEYLHLDLGSTTLTEAAVSSPGVASGSATLTVNHDYDIIRGGVNYHFGSYVPLK